MDGAGQTGAGQMGAGQVGFGQVGKAKPATAARMYDYYLGGIHNFPADQEAARRVIELFPDIPAGARANRACLRRAVRHLAGAGIRQFLDVGSGIPTQGNVHEIAQRMASDARVVYVDIDPVAVAESLDILAGNPNAIAIRADLREPRQILDHPGVRRLLDLDQPTGILLSAVLHFIPDDEHAYRLVAQLVEALAPGSYLVITHAAIEKFTPSDLQVASDVYKRQTSTPAKLRTKAEVEPFFAGLTLVEPGVVWTSAWHPDPAEDDPFTGDPERSAGWAGVAIKPA